MKLSRRGRGGIFVLTCRNSLGKRVRLSTGTRDKAEAEAMMSGLLHKLEEQGVIGDWTLAQALWSCYDKTWQHMSNPAQYESRIRRLSKHFGSQPLDQITRKWLTDSMEEFAKEYLLKDATVNRYLCLISKVISVAIDDERFDRSKRPSFPYRKEDNKKVRFISQFEQQMLIDKCYDLWPRAEANQLASLIQVLVDTGGRLSEVLSCPRHSVKQVTFTHDAFAADKRTKSKQSRSVPLTAKAERALRHVPFWSAAKCTARFTRVSRACMLHNTGVTLHTLRHTCASRLVQGNPVTGEKLDLYQVKAWLGHSSITVTERYSHLNSDHLSAGAEILEDLA